MLTAQLSKVMPADKIVKALDYLASSMRVGPEMAVTAPRHEGPVSPLMVFIAAVTSAGAAIPLSAGYGSPLRTEGRAISRF